MWHVKPGSTELTKRSFFSWDVFCAIASLFPVERESLSADCSFYTSHVED